MRTLFTAVYLFVIAYLVYVDAPWRIILASIPVYLAVYLILCFITDFLVEFRKELSRDKDND